MQRVGWEIFNISLLYPAFLVILHVTGNIGGMETKGKVRKIEGIENSLFYCSRTI